jgi:ribosomal-protein-alanine N-acetyltransferase
MTALTLLPSIGTRTLRIREIAMGDMRAFARFMTDIEYQRFLAVRYPNEYAVHQFITRAVARQDRKGRVTWHLAAEDRQSRKVLGDGFIIFHEKSVAEIGWGVDPSLWNRGYGTEIANALVAIAIERLNAGDVWCKIKSQNRASIRVAEKCGMRRDRIVDTGTGRTSPAEKICIYTLGSADYFDAPY